MGSRFIQRLVIAGFGLAVLLAGADAQAQTSSPSGEGTGTSSPPPSTTPASTPPPATPAPTATPEASSEPRITPWAWPFPWMEEALAEDEATPTPEVTATPAATETAGPQQETAGTTSNRSSSSQGSDGTLTTPNPSPSATPQDQKATEGDEQGSSDSSSGSNSTPTPSESSENAYISSSTVTPQQCEVKAVQHGIAGEGGAIMQTAVRNEDCTYGGSQVLIAYDIRGPPGIDMIVQSAGVSVEIEVLVNQLGIDIGYGYAGKDGEPLPASPSAAGPMGGATQSGDNQVVFHQDAFSETGDSVVESQRVSIRIEGNARWVRLLAQNAAAGASAETGDAVSGNDVTGNAGPDIQDSPAQAGQIGDNEAVADQDAQARSGDALAGSQELDVHVTGSVSGEVAVLAQNSANGASAASGDATATNDADLIAGPQAGSADGPAMSGQVGDNLVGVSQSASATTGDAIAGSQVIGIHVGGSVGDLAVLATNDASDTEATSGNAFAGNDANVLAGPVAAADAGDALSAQAGSNLVLVDQAAQATTGRALAGAQVISVEIGGAVGSSAVAPMNSSVGADAVSGNAVASNDLTGSVGPSATAPAGNALVQQAGSNGAEISQDVVTTSGDAVAGGQVSGVVAPQGSQAGSTSLFGDAATDPTLMATA